MIKIEAETLESAYSLAADKLSCSITQLKVEVVQAPSNGILGLFKKKAIIVAMCTIEEKAQEVTKPAHKEAKPEAATESVTRKEAPSPSVKEDKKAKKNTQKPSQKKERTAKKENGQHNDIILPASFVTDQEDDYDGSDLYDDEDEEIYIGEETEICDASHDEIHEQLASGVRKQGNSQVVDSFFQNNSYKDDQVNEVCKPSDVAEEIKKKIDALFEHACFEIDEIKVCEHDDKTILVEFCGKDAALLIGKEGYRYKALSYMLYNWINAQYQLQLRLEIAEFLKNQEEMIRKYLEGVYVNIDRDGKAQTKILDGVLVQIALRELRAAYPDKYVAIRSTRDGAKFIIINSFNNDNKNY